MTNYEKIKNMTAKCAAVRDLKREVDKSLGDIYKTLEGNIDILEDEIDKKDKEIDELNKEINELNKKIEELKQTKEVIKKPAFDCAEVCLIRIPNTCWYSIRAIIYIEPELYEITRQGVSTCINGRRYYLSNTEIIDGRLKAEFVSLMGYGLEKAEEIAKDLLSNNIYGNIKA